MKIKKAIAFGLSVAMLAAVVTGCHDSESSKVADVTYVEYDPNAAIAPYLEKLPDIPAADENYLIEMGYNDCDHMVASIIGQESGLYKALGLNVNITKTNQVVNALTAGDMDMAYASYSSCIKSYNKGAPFVTLVGSHMGGARYFVVRNEITALDQIKKLTVTEKSMQSPEWLRFSSELGMSSDVANYEGYNMSQPDSLVALKAEQIDGIFVCDPYASMAEEEGFGHVIDTAWGSMSEDLGIGWGECCTEMYNRNFVDAHPELTTRLVLAHCLATKYMYEHPYSAALMFANCFGTSISVGLHTIYLKTNAEGRTMNWEISPQNIDNLCKYYDYWKVDKENWPAVTNGPTEDFFDLSFMEASGIESFDTFLEESGINSRFPIGMSYADWLNVAETVDGVDHASTDGKNVEKWMNGGLIDKISATSAG